LRKVNGALIILCSLYKGIYDGQVTFIYVAIAPVTVQICLFQSSFTVMVC